MSRQNKVNPGMYTQRGRLTQDDAARELKRQRTIGSEHTWQPSKKDHFPRLASTEDDAALGAETSGDNESADTTPAAVNAKPAARGDQERAEGLQQKAAPAKATAKTARPGPRRPRNRRRRRAATEDGAKSRAGPQRRRRRREAPDNREAPKELIALRPRNVE